jgi:hypothetical protein
MYTLTAARDRPLGLWQMDDSSPYQDYSGYNRTATGPSTFAAALVSGAAWAAVVSNISQATFPSPVFKSNDKSFVLEAWVYPFYEGLGDIAVLSHAGQYDGLMISDTKVSFVTKYSTTGEARAEYQFERPRALHIVGVHTEGQNILYVNGESVATVDISEEQQADTFVATGDLIAGQSVGGQKMAMNGVGLYVGTLSNEQILAHFQAGRAVTPAQDVANGFAGTLIPLSKTEGSIYLESVWDTDEEWRVGTFTNVDVQDDLLVPATEEGVSLAGEWLSVFDLGFTDATSIYGVTVSWEGEGALVETSIDGTTWVPALQGQNVAAVPSGFDPTDKDLELRVTFPGGITDDTSHLSSLTVTGYSDGALPVMNNRTVVADYPAAVGVANEPIEYDERNGVDLNGADLTIGPDTGDDPTNPRTVEFWVKKTGSLPVTPTSGRTIYINGKPTPAALTDLVNGEWSLVHLVYSSGITGDIVFNGDATIGQVILYEDALTTGQIADVYKSYTGRPVLTVAGGTVQITKPPIATMVYAHDWSISGAG